MTIMLTPEQTALVESTHGPLVVYSGPGTGKTEVILHRVASLLSVDDESTFRILVLTYTRSACADMITRLERIQVPEAGERVVVRTLHAFALDVLRSYGQRVGVGHNPTIYEGKADRVAAMRDALSLTSDDSLGESSLIEVLDVLDRAWTSGDPWAHLDRSTTVWAGHSLAEIARKYLEYLTEHEALDFGALLWRAIQLFEEHPRIAEHYRAIYRYIMIDEAQDLSAAQFRFLQALCGSDHRNVFLAADPAQSIYGFRGASIMNLRDFADFLGAPWYDLEVNHRCGAAIVAAAAPLLEQSIDPRRPAKATPQFPGHVAAASYASEDAEAAAIVAWVSNLLTNGLHADWTLVGQSTPVAHEDMAVLGRIRRHLQGITDALDEAGIPFYFTAGERGVMDSTPFRLLYQALRVAASPADRAVRRSFLDTLGLQVVDEGLLEADVADFLSMATAATEPAIRPYIEWLKSLLQPEDMEASLDVVSSLALPNTLPEEEADLYEGDQEFLLDRWQRYMNVTDREHRTWNGLLLALSGEARTEPPGVRVLTAHAAKGREFAAVAVIGMNDGMFPDFRSLSDPEELDGERRLAYVAITRASTELLLTRPRTRQTRYGRRSQTMSRFLQEMDVAMDDR